MKKLGSYLVENEYKDPTVIAFDDNSDEYIVSELSKLFHKVECRTQSIKSRAHSWEPKIITKIIHISLSDKKSVFDSYNTVIYNLDSDGVLSTVKQDLYKDDAKITKKLRKIEVKSIDDAINKITNFLENI